MLKALLLLPLIFSVPAWAAPRCQAYFQGLWSQPYDVLPQDLLSYRDHEVQSLSLDDIARLNRENLAQTINFVPPYSVNRAHAIEMADARKVLSLMNSNEVVSYNGRERYRREEAEIGFCFGRATFAHLALLKMGLQKESILKVWVVGPMTAGSITWQFHVGTVVYVKNSGWMVLDPNHSNPMPLQAWYDHYNGQNADHKLRVYLTEPSKFSVTLGKYNRVQMGLDMNRENDWYKNYFVDMMASIGPKTAEQLGLRHLPPERPSAAVKPFGPLSVMLDFFSN